MLAIMMRVSQTILMMLVMILLKMPACVIGDDDCNMIWDDCNMIWALDEMDASCHRCKM